MESPEQIFITNEKNSSLEKEAILQTEVFKVVPILFGIISSTAIVGNAIVIIVIAANPVLRSTTDMLMMNLAAADLLFVIFTGINVMFKWLLDWWCKVVQNLIILAVHASIYTLVLMSLDRFLAVIYPIESMSIRTGKNALFAIGCLWLLILFMAISVGIYDGEEYNSSCIFLEQHGNQKLQIFFFLSSYIIPIFIINMLYGCLISKIWTSAPGGRVSAEIRRRRKKVTRMVVVTVLVFAVCWSPIQIILMMKAFDTYNITYVTVTAEIVSHVMAYMNSCINPVLYAFMSENFKAAFRKLMCCPPSYTKGMSGRPQPMKTTRTDNDGSSHGIELKPLCNRRHIVTEQVTAV